MDKVSLPFLGEYEVARQLQHQHSVSVGTPTEHRRVPHNSCMDLPLGGTL